jgi:MSHA biogenesis protein MshP
MTRIAFRMGGFALISAIFILVVLATLGAFMVSVFSGQQIGSGLDIQGVRAYQAARAGLEWGVYRQLIDTTCAGATSFTPSGGTFTDLTVTVTCTATADPGGFSGPTVYTISATACSEPLGAEPKCPNTTNPGVHYVERKLEVSF